MPVLTTIPDISAETLLGATGWAAGSQICRGTMPAFTPKPKRNKPNRSAYARGDGVRGNVANSKLPLMEWSTRNPVIRNPVPTCDMTKKRIPASRVSRRRCSKLTRQYADNAITSQAMRKKNAFEAVNTRLRLRSCRLKKNPRMAERLAVSADVYPKE